MKSDNSIVNIEPHYGSLQNAKLLKEKGFNIPVPHCYVHASPFLREIIYKDEEYYFEFFSFYRGTFCSTLTEVFEDQKELRGFDDHSTVISNESEIYFDYNQDIRKLIARIYNGEEWMNDEKSYNMNINSYDWEKLTPEEENNLKITLPNYNDGNFDFTVYQDVISAPEQWQILEWLRLKYNIDIEGRPVRYAGDIKTSYYQTYINGTVIDLLRYNTPQEAIEEGITHTLKFLV